MLTKNNFLLYAILCILLCNMASCSKDTPSRKNFPHSTPVIESVTVTPNPFIFGDSIHINAKVSDERTPLSTLTAKVVVNDQMIANVTMRTEGYNSEVSASLFAPLTKEIPNNSLAEVFLTLTNVEGDETLQTLDNVQAVRPVFDHLYLVQDNGTVILLSREQDSYNYINDELNIKGGSISYKIASNLTENGEIDYSQFVWASDNGVIKVMGDQGTDITTNNSDLRRTKKVTFDAFNFVTLLDGELIDPNNLVLDPNDMAETQINGILVNNISLNLTTGQELIIDGVLLDSDVYFEYNYFEKVDDDKIKFLGETGTWNIYYGISSKYLLVQNANEYAYPQIYLVCGEGLGYPSHVYNVATTSWNFQTVFDYIPFKNIGNSQYQALIYFNAEKANFKPFENDGWGGELKANEFEVPSIIDNSGDDGNWKAAAGAQSGVYLFTIDVNNKKATAELVNNF